MNIIVNIHLKSSIFLAADTRFAPVDISTTSGHFKRTLMVTRNILFQTVWQNQLVLVPKVLWAKPRGKVGQLQGNSIPLDKPYIT